MALIVFLNIKGGVAKTTTVIGVAEALAAMGRRVLVIDADHQCASSDLLLGEARFTQADSRQRTLHDLLAAMLEDDFHPDQFKAYVAPEASNVTALRPKMAALPCSFRINDFDTNMAKARKSADPAAFQSTWTKRVGAFSRWVSQNFDHALVDCPPSLARQVRFLLRAADGYVVPCIPDRISVRGALWLQDRMEKSSIKTRPLGVAWTLYREQNKNHKTMVGMVDAMAGRAGKFKELPRPFKTIIPNATAIVSAAERESPASTLAQKYSPEFASKFHELAREIEARAVATR